MASTSLVVEGVVHQREDWKNIPWFMPTLSESDDELLPDAKKLLHEYSGIPNDEIAEHVWRLRDKAFEIIIDMYIYMAARFTMTIGDADMGKLMKTMKHPYPCLGRFHFLRFKLPSNPNYQNVLERLKNGQSLLDLGCCFGHELRKLVFDGAPMENLYGSDLRMDFISLGYDLFLDKDNFHAHFIAADIFDSESDLIKQLAGRMDIVFTGSFFHLFDWDGQVEAMKQVVKLLRPQPGSLVLGHQVGNKKPGSWPRRLGDGQRYRHDESTMVKMWEEVGQATGTTFKVETSAYVVPVPAQSPSTAWLTEGGLTLITFSVTRQ